MRYWLSSDGGGTKLIMLLIDEGLSVVRAASAGGVNPNFISEELIRRNMDSCLRGIFDAFPGVKVEGCYSSMPCPIHHLEAALSDAGVKTPVTQIPEGQMGLLAGLCRREGFAALSGTGSDAFYYGPAGRHVVGGWGTMLGDEGSGSKIGQNGLVAVIHALDGRGESTVLLDEIADFLSLDAPVTEQLLRDTLVRRIYRSASPRSELASFAPHVSKACDRGDRVAKAILTGAGEDLGRHMAALIRRVLTLDPDALSMPSTLCGGVWKGSREILRAYRDYMRDAYPQLEIRWPMFDAVAGGAVMAGFSQGYSQAEIRARMTGTFSDYIYPKE
ncbi:MAG: hypothetical protein FWH02_05990 [Oscillospiraceae bacterium]|nr:hypothetical protein [Oscillospiraceae bacterium]